VQGADQQRLAVETGAWPLWRFDPRRVRAGEPPLVLDSGPPKRALHEYTRNEARFRMVEKQDPARYKDLLAHAQSEATRRFAVYQQLAGLTVPQASETAAQTGTARPLGPA
jgi:pyruvate-ferredoxin/flavodoxin oxidoreductase